MKRKQPTLSRLAAFLAATVVGCGVATSHAQTWPGKPVRLVHTAAAGSMSDNFTRIIADGLSRKLGQTLIVDARPGASGFLASQEVARAPADGYTLLLGTMSSHVLNPILLKPPYDAVKDFSPVALLASTPLVLVANQSMPKDLAELTTYIRQRPGEVTFATWGNATLSHLATELWMSMTNTSMIHVPYRGAAPARLDLMAGRISIMFSDMTGMKDVQTGRLHPIGATGSVRSAAYPNLPLLSELGLPGYEALGWFAIYAPAGAPKEVVARINHELVALFGQPEFRKRIQDLGVDPTYADSEQLATRMRQDLTKWARIVKDKNIRVD